MRAPRLHTARRHHNTSWTSLHQSHGREWQLLHKMVCCETLQHAQPFPPCPRSLSVFADHAVSAHITSCVLALLAPFAAPPVVVPPLDLDSDVACISVDPGTRPASAHRPYREGSYVSQPSPSPSLSPAMLSPSPSPALSPRPSPTSSPRCPLASEGTPRFVATLQPIVLAEVGIAQRPLSHPSAAREVHELTAAVDVGKLCLEQPAGPPSPPSHDAWDLGTAARPLPSCGPEKQWLAGSNAQVAPAVLPPPPSLPFPSTTNTGAGRSHVTGTATQGVVVSTGGPAPCGPLLTAEPRPVLDADAPIHHTAELLAAVKGGTASQVATLLELGADPTACDTATWSSTHIAAWRRRSDVLQVLVDFVGRSPCVCRRDCILCAPSEFGGDHATELGGQSCVCAQQGRDVCARAVLLQRGSGGNTCLHLACTPHPLVAPTVLASPLCTAILCKVRSSKHASGAGLTSPPLPFCQPSFLPPGPYQTLSTCISSPLPLPLTLPCTSRHFLPTACH